VGQITTFILAGGKSTRMGTDKAFVELGGRTLMAHALEIARAVGGEVWIAGDVVRFEGYGRVVEDIYRNRGPLAGIHAALRSTSTDLNLMLAVDLPFIPAAFLEYLIRQAKATEAVVTVPRDGGRLQPLCAVYRKAFALVAERSLQAGENKIDPLFSLVATRVLEEAELRNLGFSATMFGNLNTREDLDRANRQWRKTQGK
jgi:molybdenum cofactor guanylyltransferase